MLPDVEEINSSLRPSDTGHEDIDPVAEEKRSRSGFRLGFGVVLLIAAALTAAYTYAEEIGTAIPALAVPLADYADAVDEGRLWLDLQLQSFLDETPD